MPTLFTQSGNSSVRTTLDGGSILKLFTESLSKSAFEFFVFHCSFLMTEQEPQIKELMDIIESCDNR